MTTESLVEIAVPDNRIVERASAELKTIVQVRESETDNWKEITRVTTVSRNGAGFSLTRPVNMGRLVSLVMPLEAELRAYDLQESLYPVMGLVQYCNRGIIDGKPVYHVGVGFIGKTVPASYKANPMQNYRISGMSVDGLWTVAEAQVQFKNRKQPRHWMSIPVSITLVQKAEKSTAKEETITRNVGSGGVSVYSSLDAVVGDTVKFACKEIDFYAMAVVRNRQVKPNELPTLHLQFVDREFPVNKLLASLGISVEK